SWPATLGSEQMPLAGELQLTMFDHTDAGLRGPHYREAMTALQGHDGWLAACPFGFLVLERESAEFFLRTRDAIFPGLTIDDLLAQRPFGDAEEIGDRQPGEDRVARAQEELGGLALEHEEAERACRQPAIVALQRGHRLAVARPSQPGIGVVEHRQLKLAGERHLLRPRGCRPAREPRPR